MIQTSDVRIIQCWTAVYDRPAKAGKVKRETSAYIEDVNEFRARAERLGYTVISLTGPRPVETIDVNF